jgi:hypothetical protein
MDPNYHGAAEFPRLVQGGTHPLARGAGGASLVCACGSVLVEGYDSRQLIALALECRCGTVTNTPPWPECEALPNAGVMMRPRERYVVSQPIELRRGVLIHEGEITRVRGAIGPRRAPEGVFSLEAAALQQLKSDISGGSPDAFAKAEGKVRQALKLSSGQELQYPAAWAFHHIRTQMERGSIDLHRPQDRVALSFLHWMFNNTARWKHHPLFPRFARGLINDFHHEIAMLTAASFLVDAGNQVGFTFEDRAEGRSSDLYVNMNATQRLSIEVKAPKHLHWPCRVPAAGAVERAIERAAKNAKGQVSGASGALLVVGGFHLSASFAPNLFRTAQHVLEHHRISGSFAAVLTVCYQPVNVEVMVQKDGAARVDSLVQVHLHENPKYRGASVLRYSAH